MPDKKLLEEFPLYRKLQGVVSFAGGANTVPKPAINMLCETCKSQQTFRMTNEYWEPGTPSNVSINGKACKLLYVCSHCGTFTRAFLVIFDGGLSWVMKVGQFPPWDIAGDPNIEAMLGKHSTYYKKGLICESQGYGIGAFGYYRRIVEEIIDSLLDDIGNLLAGNELVNYKLALEQTKKTTVAQEKIELVKALLPPILRPDGMNPLSTLHSALSEGLHAESDEECLEYAEACREVLVFLVGQVALNREAKKHFTAGMRKLLDRKAKLGM